MLYSRSALQIDQKQLVPYGLLRLEIGVSTTTSALVVVVTVTHLYYIGLISTTQSVRAAGPSIRA
jgi:hypothetical protein